MDAIGSKKDSAFECLKKACHQDRRVHTEQRLRGILRRANDGLMQAHRQRQFLPPLLIIIGEKAKKAPFPLEKIDMNKARGIQGLIEIGEICFPGMAAI